MKNRILNIAIITVISAIAACTKSKNFVADNTSLTGVGSRPVSSNPLRVAGTTSTLDGSKFAAGTTFSTELQFFSESPIKEINLYSTVGAGARTKTSTYPYAPAFSTFKGTDTLLVPFTMPTVASGTAIKLEYEILNQNALNLIRTATVKVQ